MAPRPARYCHGAVSVVLQKFRKKQERRGREESGGARRREEPG